MITEISRAFQIIFCIFIFDQIEIVNIITN